MTDKTYVLINYLKTISCKMFIQTVPFRFRLQNNNFSLIIENSREEDSGLYSCHLIFDKNKEISKQFQVYTSINRNFIFNIKRPILMCTGVSLSELFGYRDHPLGNHYPNKFIRPRSDTETHTLFGQLLSKFR
jgi:hypothetical protein